MKNIKPFDTSKKPKNPYHVLLPIEWAGSLYYIIGAKGAKITKHNCENLKAPYLLLSNHASMIDMPMAVKATFPHRAGWVASIEEFIGREFLIRGVGGIYKRKFTSDVTVIKHIYTLMKKHKKTCIMYPEARFSLAGINEHMSDGIGKLVKHLKCPVAVLIEHGNFVCCPQWDKNHCRHSKVCGDLTQIVTKEEAETLSADEIQARIEAAFVYDDYQWQYDNKIAIRSNKRANNIHRILYQCPVCKKEFSTDSKDTEIWCNECGARWQMDEYGKLKRTNGEDVFTHVPDWYRWERENVDKEVSEGKYSFSDTVRLDRLVNGSKGFRTIGNVALTHDGNGFTMKGVLDSGEEFNFNRSPESMESCHIEYAFKKKGVKKPGPAIDLCTMNDTYFVFLSKEPGYLTKIHFATEALNRQKTAENAAKLNKKDTVNA